MVLWCGCVVTLDWGYAMSSQEYFLGELRKRIEAIKVNNKQLYAVAIDLTYNNVGNLRVYIESTMQLRGSVKFAFQNGYFEIEEVRFFHDQLPEAMVHALGILGAK